MKNNSYKGNSNLETIIEENYSEDIFKFISFSPFINYSFHRFIVLPENLLHKKRNNSVYTGGNERYNMRKERIKNFVNVLIEG